MQDWKTYRLSELVTLLGDGIHGTPKYTDNGEYYFINGNNLIDGDIIIKPDTKRVSKDEYLKHKRNLTDRTLLVSINGTIGKVAYYKQEKVMLGKSACYFNIKEGVSKGFIKHVISSKYFINYLETNFTGSVIKNVSLKSMRDFPINLPPFQEQKAIASILSALDDKIELNLQMNKTLEEMAMALYKYWFVDFGPFQNGKFVESELGMIPEGWEMKKVKDYGDVITGKTPSKSFAEHFGNYIPFVTPTGFSKYGMHITESDRMISQIGYEKHYRSIIPVNSVIVTCIGSDMGKVSISKIECLTNQQINSLKCESYIFMYFFFINSYKLLKRLAGDGTTMPIINKSTFENIEVISPPKIIIRQFENMVVEFDNQIESNTLENQTLTTLRDTLLPKLISGEVRVKDIEQMVAAAL